MSVFTSALVCAWSSAYFPLIILCVSMMSNETLAVWRMLFNHANQYQTRSLQGYYLCWPLSEADLLPADLLCPLPAAPASDTTAVM